MIAGCHWLARPSASPVEDRPRYHPPCQAGEWGRRQGPPGMAIDALTNDEAMQGTCNTVFSTHTPNGGYEYFFRTSSVCVPPMLTLGREGHSCLVSTTRVRGQGGVEKSDDGATPVPLSGHQGTCVLGVCNFPAHVGWPTWIESGGVHIWSHFPWSRWLFIHAHPRAKLALPFFLLLLISSQANKTRICLSDLWSSILSNSSFQPKKHTTLFYFHSLI